MQTIMRVAQQKEPEREIYIRTQIEDPGVAVVHFGELSPAEEENFVLHRDEREAVPRRRKWSAAYPRLPHLEGVCRWRE